MNRLTVLVLLLACNGSPKGNVGGDGGKPLIDGNGGSTTGGGGTAGGGGATGAATIVAGGQHTCLLRGGQLTCWGSARHGSLGANVAAESTMVPTAFPGLTGATAVALGDNHGCALLAGGAVSCWGSNEYRALGDPAATADAPAPVPVKGIQGATAIAAGRDRSCAIVAGAVWCWGNFKPPAAVAGATDAVQVTIGDAHVCARTRAGGVSCWGDNDHGQLGEPAGAARDQARPVAGLTGVTDVSAGGDFTCAVAGGKVSCWGAGGDAQLGDPARADSAAPRIVAGTDGAQRVAVGQSHACALRAGGDVVCWGGADYESFGFPRDCPKDRTAERRGDNGREVMISLYCAAPLPVPGLGKVTELVHGLGHACAGDGKGGVRCWGGMGAGELGNREHGADGSHDPVAVTFPAPTAPSGAKAVAIAARGNWSCAALVGGTLSCWGGAPFDEIPGTGSTAKPTAITGLTGVTDVALGVYHACVILRDGGVRCWGYNGEGELGDGSTQRRMAPITPPGLPPIAEVAMPWSQSQSHTCARSRAGDVYCWGNNGAGQSQPGGPVHVATPVKVAGIAGASALALSSQGSCALVGGVPRCWGSVVATPGSKLGGKPAPLAGLDHVAEIGLGETVACARRDDGTVWCWGNRGKDPAPAAIEVGGKARVLAVAGYRGAAIRDDGSVVSWWLESDGKPDVVRGAAGATDLALSGDHACAIDGQGRVLCWGSNSMGQLGNPDQGTGGNNEIAGPAAL